MSGSGRKSHYRKSVTEEFLNGFPLPENGDEIGLVINSRGTNIFELEMRNGNIELAMLPNKFKKLIWIKRGDYLIVSSAEVDDDWGDDCKVKHMIKCILNDKKIAHIKANSLWPSEFKVEERQSEETKASSPYYDTSDMPTYDDDDMYEDECEQEVKVDKMGNIIEDDQYDEDDEN